MWIDVEYQESLKLNQKVRVKFTRHEALINRVMDKDELGQKLHCLCYSIEPKDPKDPGGHWYFSHDFEK
jgi:head-tail adaptor